MKQTENFSSTMSKRIEKVRGYLTGEEDILSVIKEDHKPLKELIQIMKDSEKPLAERIEAFQDFAPLLVTHAKAEEKSLYDFMKTVEPLRQHAFEGEAEHSNADQLCEEIERSSDEDEVSGKIKVLAEAVEHHIKEEENEIIPDVEKNVQAEALKRLLPKYVEVQEELIGQGQDDSPRERETH